MTSALCQVCMVAAEAQSQLRAAMARFSLPWIYLAASCTAAVLIAAWLLGAIFTEWQRHENLNLMDERDELKAEVALLCLQSEDWAKRAGRARHEKCGDPARLCVRGDKRIAYGPCRFHSTQRTCLIISCARPYGRKSE